MQVLEVIQDGNNYQDARCPGFDQLRTEQWDLDGTTRSAAWSPVQLVVRNPKARKTHFLTWAGNKFVLTAEQLDDPEFGPILIRSGELLPITIDDKEAKLLNVIPKTDCVDDQKSLWRDNGGTRKRLMKVYFLPDKVPKGKFFKLMHGPAQMFIAHFPGENRLDDFKAIYDRRKCKGLRFRLLWDSDDPSAPVVEF
ncbi:MAG: hypothetical protein RLZZ476_1304 [Verrucomicrobiota bacterium]|jgi:hypothetical protein